MRSALLDDDVVAFAAEQSRRTAHEFDKELEGTTVPLLQWGEHAEFRALTADGRPRIFVVRDGIDWWRIRYQIAHEVFHCLCTPPRTFHWAHELLAVETAVRAMEEIGEHDYAQREMERLAEQAELLPRRAMLVTPLGDVYPPGLYGRAWMTGRELIDAVGWERLKPLANSFDDEGKPDVVGWVRALGRRERAAVEDVLGEPSPEWI